MQNHPEKGERLWRRTGTPRIDMGFLSGLECEQYKMRLAHYWKDSIGQLDFVKELTSKN
jgi:hypothetical protein